MTDYLAQACNQIGMRKYQEIPMDWKSTASVSIAFILIAMSVMALFIIREVKRRYHG